MGMPDILVSSDLIDLVLLFTLAEAAALVFWRRYHGHGLRPTEILRMLLPGVFLLLAVRAAIAGAGPAVPLALTAALLAHLLDLKYRWRG